MPLKLSNIDPDAQYNLQEVQELLRLSYSTVRNLIKSGKLSSVKIGKRYYVLGSNILTFVGKPPKQPT